MKRLTTARLSMFLLAASCISQALNAQQPLGPEFVVGDPTIGATFQSGPQPACDALQACAVFWTSNVPQSPSSLAQIWGAVVSEAGAISRRKELSTNGSAIYPAPVGLESGFAIFWDQDFPDRSVSPVFQVYAEDLTPVGERVRVQLHGSTDPNDPQGYGGILSVRRIPDGFALLSVGNNSGPLAQGWGIYLYFLDLQGGVLRNRVRVSEDPEGSYFPSVFRGGLAVDRTGRIAVTYSRLETAKGPSDIYVRRLSSDGEPVGGEVRVNQFVRGEQVNPQVATSPEGGFLVVWQSAGQDGSSDGIFGRRFGASGLPLSSEFQVNEVTASAQRFPLVESDNEGNDFVTWSSGHPTSETIGYEVKGRLYRRDGVPAGGEIHLNQDRLFAQTGGWTAFTGQGSLLSVWQSESFRQAGDAAMTVVARSYSASPGAEICTIDGPAVACDLGRTGGGLELKLTWGGRPGEVMLFGDWDGDGRDDLCAFFRGRFRCDLGHNGAPAEVFETFGLPSDVPLLADVDGDRLADPCVRRGPDLLCDTRRDGRVHLQTRFGEGDETSLLGDLDGDGRADLCLVTGNQWRCRPARGGTERHFSFGRTSDSFALGDADRDGRADPCILRAGEVLCDLAHDGGESDFRLELDAPSGAGLLFGNLDGL